MWLLGIRFAIAGALMAVICLPKWKELDKQTVCHGVWMGMLLYMEFFFFTVGIQYTTASRSAFVVAAYIIFVPGAYWLVFRKRPGKLDVAASVTCLLGAAIILLDSAGGGINKGDLLTVGSSLFYAVHVMYGSVYAKQHSPLLLNMLQIGHRRDHRAGGGISHHSVSGGGAVRGLWRCHLPGGGLHHHPVSVKPGGTALCAAHHQRRHSFF